MSKRKSKDPDPEQINRFYLTNYDFQIYCNKNIQTYGRTLQHELQNPITIEYYKTLQRGGCNEQQSHRRENNRCDE